MGSKKRGPKGSTGEGLPKITGATIEISTRFDTPVLGLVLRTANDHLEGEKLYQIPYFTANIFNFERRVGEILDSEEWGDIARMVGNALELGGVGVTYRLEDGKILDERLP